MLFYLNKKQKFSSKPNRIYWVDNLKAFVIIMVMVAHMEAQTNTYLRIYLYNITMPLFVSISGFLFRPEKYQGPKEFITRKFLTLMIPYFFFSFMAYGMQLLFDNYIEGIPLTFSVLDALLWIAHGNWFYIRFAYNPALWFLPYLFLIEVEFYFLSKLKKSFWGLMVIPLYALGIVLGRQIPHLPWTFAGSLVGLLFYWFGFLIKENISLLETRHKPIIILLSGTISIIFCYSNLPFAGGPGLDGYGENSLFFALANLAGVIFFFTLTNYTRPNRMLSYIGANTIMFFAFSLPLLELFPKLIAFFKLEIVYSMIPVSSNDQLNPIIAGLNNTLWVLLAIVIQLLIVSLLIPIFNKKLYFVLGREKPK